MARRWCWDSRRWRDDDAGDGDATVGAAMADAVMLETTMAATTLAAATGVQLGCSSGSATTVLGLPLTARR